MVDIPEDVMAAADEWSDELYEGVSIEVPTSRALNVIAHAILAERQRCADVARAYLEDLAGCDMRDDEPELIAAAILS